MKKIILITFITFASLLTLTLFKIKEYKDYNMLKQGNNQIKYIENKIDENNFMLEQTVKEENELKEKQNEKVELLNVWQKMLEKLKQSI